MEVKLKVCVGSNAGKELRIPGPKFLIGRAEDCHLRPKSDLISRHHCVLLIDENGAAVRDLGSRNGTIVNGERVVGERELIKGDNLKIGPLEFEIVMVPVPAPQKRPKVTSIADAATRTAEGRPPVEEPDFSQWLVTESTPAAGATQPEVKDDTETRELESIETEEIQLDATLLNMPPLKQQPSAPGATSTTIVQQPAPEPTKPTAEAAQADVDLGATMVDAGDSHAANKGKTPPPPNQPGRLPLRRTADSRQAANDVLRKFFNRR